MQNTIKNSFSISGVGLHTGEHSKVTFHPSPANTGIVFKRTDLNIHEEEKIIKVDFENISKSELCTQIQNEYGHKVSTIEHIMSALHGLFIDNVLIDITNSEAPILDGSSIEYVNKIKNIGIKELNENRKIYKVLKTISYSDGDSTVKISPSVNLSIDYTITYDHCLINNQNFFYNHLSPEDYENIISSARTFGFKKEVDELKSKGLIAGGSLDNAIVLDEQGVLNNEGLRFKDEFVRHKILDFIGDIYLLGNSIKAHVEVVRGGHWLTHEAIKKLMSDNDNWKITDEFEDDSNSSSIDRSKQDKEITISL